MNARYDLAGEELDRFLVDGVDLDDEVLGADVDQRLVVSGDLFRRAGHEGAGLGAASRWRSGRRLSYVGDFLRHRVFVRAEHKAQREMGAQDLIVGTA